MKVKPPMLAGEALARLAAQLNKAELIDVIADILVRLQGENGSASDAEVLDAFTHVATRVRQLRSWREPAPKGGVS